MYALAFESFCVVIKGFKNPHFAAVMIKIISSCKINRQMLLLRLQ